MPYPNLDIFLCPVVKLILFYLKDKVPNGWRTYYSYKENGFMKKAGLVFFVVLQMGLLSQK
jgi:hypothetical protein